MINQSSRSQLPEWLQQAIIEGDSVAGVRNKRAEDRMVSALFCQIESDGQPGEILSARVHNVSESGLGMITRRWLRPGQRIQLTPADGSDGEPVTATVVHCTQTIQGYKVGCAFVRSG